MIIKKYQAKTELEAMQTAKMELGPNVVLMNVRQIKKKGIMKFFSSPTVEITVALEEDTERPAIRSVSTPQSLAKAENKTKENSSSDNAANKEKSTNVIAVLEDAMKEKSRQMAAHDQSTGNKVTTDEEEDTKKPDSLEKKLDSLENLLKKSIDADDNKDSDKEEVKSAGQETMHMKLTKLLYNMMIDNEVHEKYANAIIDEAEKVNKPNMPVDYFLTNIYQKMILRFGQTTTITPAAMGPRVVYFIGPTGVGKTTTIAKIASKFCIEEKKKVALLTADTYRIAAAEQLKTYANILEIPCNIIYSASEIEQAYEDFIDYDYILVDTAGHSHQNEEQKSNTNTVIHALDGKTESEVYLVLSATTKYKDLVSIADTYKEMTEYKIIFTKLDETTSLGNLLNLKLYTGADLSYVTYGQNVPDDIDKFDPQSTVKSILGGNH